MPKETDSDLSADYADSQVCLFFIRICFEMRISDLGFPRFF